MGGTQSIPKPIVTLRRQNIMVKRVVRFFSCNPTKKYFVTIDVDKLLSIRRLVDQKLMRTFYSFKIKSSNLAHDINPQFQQKNFGTSLSFIWQSKQALFIQTRLFKIIRSCKEIHKLQTKNNLDLIFISQERYFLWDPFTAEFKRIGNLIHSNYFNIGLTPDWKSYVVAWVERIGGEDGPGYYHYTHCQDIDTKLKLKLTASYDSSEILQCPNLKVIFAPNARLFIVFSQSQQDQSTKFSVWNFPPQARQLWSDYQCIQIKGCSFSQDNQLVMITDRDNIKMYRSQNGQRIYTLNQPYSDIKLLIGFTSPNTITLVELNDRLQTYQV